MSTSEPETKKLEGIGGWLILVGFIVIASPIRQMIFVAPFYSQLFLDGTLGEIFNPASPSYSPFLGAIIISEFTINLCIFFTWIYIAYLFFTKNHLFPLFFRSMLIFILIFIIVDALVVSAALPNQAVFDAETIKEAVRSAIAAAIWVPYTLLSKRVQNTFVDRSQRMQEVFE